jgi:hypothetical protein
VTQSGRRADPDQGWSGFIVNVPPIPPDGGDPRKRLGPLFSPKHVDAACAWSAGIRRFVNLCGFTDSPFHTPCAMPSMRIQPTRGRTPPLLLTEGSYPPSRSHARQGLYGSSAPTPPGAPGVHPVRALTMLSPTRSFRPS